MGSTADAVAEFLRERNVLALDVALDERVFELQRDEAMLTLFFDERLRARGVPRGHIGKTGVADFAFAHEVVERADNFLDGRDLVPAMEPVEIDKIGAEPLERGFERAVDIFAAIAAGIGISLLGAQGEFGGQRDLVAEVALANEFADEFLALAIGVAVGGVDEVAASVDVMIEDGLVIAPAPFGAEGHGS